jgi:hypothetical protein
VNDLGTVAAQLPRAPHDAGIIVYAVRGSDQAGQAYRDLVRVRKKTVEAYLRFFARHHAIYKAGIHNFNSSSSDPQAADYYLVRPFTEADIDMAMVNSLPDDGVPDEDWAEKAFGDTSFAMRKVELKENEACGADEEMPHQAANDGDSDSGDDGDSSGEGDDNEQPPLRRSSQGPPLANSPVGASDGELQAHELGTQAKRDWRKGVWRKRWKQYGESGSFASRLVIKKAGYTHMYALELSQLSSTLRKSPHYTRPV